MKYLTLLATLIFTSGFFVFNNHSVHERYHLFSGLTVDPDHRIKIDVLADNKPNVSDEEVDEEKAILNFFNNFVSETIIGNDTITIIHSKSKISNSLKRIKYNYEVIISDPKTNPKEKYLPDAYLDSEKGVSFRKDTIAQSQLLFIKNNQIIIKGSFYEIFNQPEYKTVNLSEYNYKYHELLKTDSMNACDCIEASSALLEYRKLGCILKGVPCLHYHHSNRHTFGIDSTGTRIYIRNSNMENFWKDSIPELSKQCHLHKIQSKIPNNIDTTGSYVLKITDILDIIHEPGNEGLNNKNERWKIQLKFFDHNGELSPKELILSRKNSVEELLNKWEGYKYCIQNLNKIHQNQSIFESNHQQKVRNSVVKYD